MTAPSELSPDPRATAKAEATALLGTLPWSEVASRGLLLLVRPPAAAWAESIGISAAWLILDATEARSLPPTWREPLMTDGVARAAAERRGMELVVFTSEALGRALEGVPRSSLEMRWTVRHAEPLHDPLHRADSLSRAAGRLPADALERVVRPLFVQAGAALAALGHIRVSETDATLATAGEAATNLARLACVLEEGHHPPLEYLLAAARQTRLGERITPWLNDLAAAVSGESRAAVWIRESGPGVIREAATALHAEFAGRDWLADPETYALRPTR